MAKPELDERCGLFRPMLAAKPKPEKMAEALAALRFPLLASPKLDGIRAMVQNGKLYSRALKLIPNKEMQKLWGREEFNGLDGEIITGPAFGEGVFARSTSHVMSSDKTAKGSTFFVFDCYSDEEPFDCRSQDADKVVDYQNMPQAKHVRHVFIKNLKTLLKYEEQCLATGYEGIMLRDPEGRYKQGRSTLREGGLIAVKRFTDAEAVILDTYEQEENTNEKTTNELGRSKRSSHQAGKRGKGTLGGFTVCMAGVFDSLAHAVTIYGVDSKDKRFFDIGTGVGLTDAVRDQLWVTRRSLIGKVLKFRYQKVGTKDAPRQPIFLGFRDAKDL